MEVNLRQKVVRRDGCAARIVPVVLVVRVIDQSGSYPRVGWGPTCACRNLSRPSTADLSWHAVTLWPVDLTITAWCRRLQSLILDHGYFKLGFKW